jgi:NitT/TauT family transport system permease protein
MMAEEVRSIPREEFEHARTLGMKEWRVVWEVVIMGRMDRVVEVLRQNTAISWLMLTTVEGLVRTEGGIGAMLLVQSKFLRVSEVLAIQITILLVGMSLDWLCGTLRRVFFPYAFFDSEGRS